MFGNKADKAKKVNLASRTNLEKFIDNLIDRTKCPELKQDMRSLVRTIGRFEPCSDERAIELDKVIYALLKKFHEGKKDYTDIFKRVGSEAAIIETQYEQANRAVFEKFAPFLNEMLASRNSLMGPSGFAMSKKEKKAELKNDEQKVQALIKDWKERGYSLDLTIEYLLVFYEIQTNKALQEKIKEKQRAAVAKNDRATFSLLNGELKTIEQRGGFLADWAKKIRAKIDVNDLARNLIDDTNINEILSNKGRSTDDIQKIAKDSEKSSQRTEREQDLQASILGKANDVRKGTMGTFGDTQADDDLAFARMQSQMQSGQLDAVGAKGSMSSDDADFEKMLKEMEGK